MGDIHTDERGYPRGKDGKLIHRKVAYKDYKENKRKYSKPFSKYQVHHKDGNKSNFRSSNLEIVTEDEHQKIHGLRTIEDDRNVAIGGISAFLSFLITSFIIIIVNNINILRDTQIFAIAIIIFLVVWFLISKYIDEDKILLIGLALICTGIVFWTLNILTGENYALSFRIALLFLIGFLFKIYHVGFKKNKWKFLFWGAILMLLLFAPFLSSFIPLLYFFPTTWEQILVVLVLMGIIFGVVKGAFWIIRRVRK